MAKAQELKEVEKVSMADYSDITMQLLDQRKRELADLQHNYLMLHNSLKDVQAHIAREKSEFVQWKTAEEQRKNKELIRRQQDMDAKEHALQINVNLFDKRSAELKVREQLVSTLTSDRQKLNDDRVEVEKLRTKAEQLMSSAVKKQSEAQSLFNNARLAEENAKKLEEKANLTNADLSKREAQLKADVKDYEVRMRNFTEAKKEIDSRIKELEEFKKAQ